MKILIVEDNVQSNHQLKLLLEANRYQTDSATTVAEAKTFLETTLYDLCLLDWNLPDGEGIDIVNMLRESGESVPVLMTSARDTVMDKIKALDIGADDYISKPYSNLELLARIRALLRRDTTQKQTRVTIGSVTLDQTQRKVFVEEEERELSLKEFELLELLMMNKNIVITHSQISEHLFKSIDKLPSSNIIAAHIKNLRNRLQPATIIETVRGVGYTVKG